MRLALAIRATATAIAAASRRDLLVRAIRAIDRVLDERVIGVRPFSLITIRQ